MMIRIISFLGMMIICFSAFAAEKWNGNIRLSYFSATGNSDTSNFDVSMTTGRVAGKNTVVAYAGAAKGKSSGETNRDERSIYLLNEHRCNEKHGWYVKGEYFKNELKGVARQDKIGIGYLHYWYEKSGEYFKTRVGYERANTEYTDDTDKNINYLKLGFMSKKNLNESLSWNVKADWIKERNYQKNKEIEISNSLNCKVTQQITFEFSHLFQYVEQPYVAGKDSVDRTLRSAIVYSF